ncbi:hypothetical protein BDK51DRAFT_52488 [Blyttiomyces helicus]|uniref:Uncharacterized protein n=1 Tax=Blyttiomyces helicus TaxID=388810 RepID=A0A4P9WTY5_9FUNG|nr:hypothetical protein BDK51DRAFT_52488 [Blyttiomyces helicus]|eukprot:RKO94566.1 hypothetical protein BDK51DRAFT_52488 [Blyttiomyces helicus]
MIMMMAALGTVRLSTVKKNTRAQPPKERFPFDTPFGFEVGDRTRPIKALQQSLMPRNTSFLSFPLPLPPAKASVKNSRRNHIHYDQSINQNTDRQKTECLSNVGKETKNTWSSLSFFKLPMVSITTAKYVSVPLIIGAFIIYSGACPMWERGQPGAADAKHDCGARPLRDLRAQPRPSLWSHGRRELDAPSERRDPYGAIHPSFAYPTPFTVYNFYPITGFMIYQYVVQEPGITLQLVTASMISAPLPTFVFRLPFGEDVNILSGNPALLKTPLFAVASKASWRAWLGARVNTGKDPCDARVGELEIGRDLRELLNGSQDPSVLTDYFTFSNRSFVSTNYPAGETYFIMQPRPNTIGQTSRAFQLAVNVAFNNLVANFPTQQPPLTPKVDTFILGSATYQLSPLIHLSPSPRRRSRLTDPSNPFGTLRILNLSDPFFNNAPPDDYFASGVARDINPYVWNGNWNFTSNYDWITYKYEYLNGSSEWFYELTKTGSAVITEPASTSQQYQQIIFGMSSIWVTKYSEFLPNQLGSTIASIATAFQVLLLTGLVALFGRGRFSPYGAFFLTSIFGLSFFRATRLTC